MEEEYEENVADLRDINDIASAQEHRFLQESIARQREANKPQTHPDFDGEHCIDCGEDIPEGRLAMHKIRCVECQSFIDEKSKMFGK